MHTNHGEIRSHLYDNALAEASRISHMIAGSELYRRYQAAKTAVAKDFRISNMLEEYKRLNTEYRQKSAHGAYNFDSEKQVSGLYWDLMLNNDAAEYLRCERDLAAVISGVVEKLTGDCPLYL